MKARWRILVAVSAALLGTGTPAFAQETTAPAQSEAIGPPQLRDFSLNGTVEREAAAPVQIQPRQRDEAPAASGEAQRTTIARPAQPSGGAARTAARVESAARQPQREAPTAEAYDFAPATSEARLAASSAGGSNGTSAMVPQPASIPAPPDSSFGLLQSGSGLLPWLLAALGLAGFAAWYFNRNRLRESFAGAGDVSAFEAPSAPPPAAPVRTPPPAAPVGIVSTRLRPWLELQFTPLRGVVDEEKAAIAFELSVFNSGSAPARDVLLEATLFNAGPMQDQQIKLFFENPVAKGDKIPVIAPLQRMSVETAVFLAREQVRPIEIEGRTLFVPIVAFNALYSWGGGKGQTSASYLVGKTTKGDKLAPFRMDLGPRVFRGLAAREHELRLRK